MALAEKLNQRPEKKGGEPKRKGRREIIPFITVAALTAAGGAALITPQGEAHAQGPNPTPTPEPSPTPTESGAIIPGVEAGETLAMGGTNWHITKFDAAYYASLLSQLEEKFTIIDNGNGLVFNLSYFDSQSRLSIILPHGPQGFEWDGKNQIWRNPQNPNAVLLPQIALPGGWNEEKNIAGPAVVPEVVLMLKDSQRNIIVGTVYNNEALRSAGIVDSNIIPLDNNRSIFLGNPKNLELKEGQRIEAIYDEETNQILYHKLINRDGSWKKILTDWDQLDNPQQVNHMFEPIGIQIGDEITDVPYPSDSLMTIENPNAPIPQFINALNKAGINISAEEIKSRITYVSTKEDGTPLVDKDGNPFVVAVYKTGQQQEQRKLSVISQSLNLRSGPSTNDGIITSLPYNTVLTPTGEKSPDGSWIKVRTPDGQIGWVSSQYTQETQSTQDNSLIDNIPLLIATKGENGWEWRKLIEKDVSRIPIGSEIKPTAVHRQFIPQHFNAAHLMYDTEWVNMEPTPGNILDENPKQWAFLKTNLEIAESNQMYTLAGPLFYSATYPDWVHNLTPEQMREAIHRRIEYLLTNYPQIDFWIGLNEYFPTSWEIKPDVIQDKLGYYDFLDLVYLTAQNVLDRNHNNALLIYNYDHNHSISGHKLNSSNYPETLKHIKRLKAMGVRNIAAGLQMHIDATHPPTKDEIIEAMKSYGVPVVITELDVDISGIANQDRLLIQAQIYHTIFEAALDSGVCRAIFMFQVGDKYSWLETNLGKSNADPTPYDDNLNPKISAYVIRAVLFNDLLQFSQ